MPAKGYISPGRALSEDQIRYILTSQESDAAIAAEVGVSRACVSKVRAGKSYLDVCPELPRRGPYAPPDQSSCFKCIHHKICKIPRGGKSRRVDERVTCTLGFPDPLQEGARFARWCSTYQEQPTLQLSK